jgi:hypothetical protein
MNSMSTYVAHQLYLKREYEEVIAQILLGMSQGLPYKCGKGYLPSNIALRLERAPVPVIAAVMATSSVSVLISSLHVISDMQPPTLSSLPR